MDFNPTTTGADSPSATQTENYEGGEAWVPDDPRFELYLLVTNNLLENTYYRDDDQALAEVRQAVDETITATGIDTATAGADPAFVLRLAAYARQEMNLRDVPQVLLVEAAHRDATKPFVREWAPAIIQRADEPTTVVAIHDQLYGGTLPNALKNGINDALHQFDAYQFAKYSRDQRAVSLRDVVNRTHPRPRDDERAEIFRRLIRGPLSDYPEVDPLETPETWEAVISERGSTHEAWEDVLPRMGLFATLRNLRNLLDAGVAPETIVDENADAPDWIGDTHIYPFRIYQGYKAVQKAHGSVPVLETWLSSLIDGATQNVPDRLGNSLVAVDLSGSMNSPLSKNSALTYRELASFFGAVCGTRGADVWAFASDVEAVHAHHATPTLEWVDKIESYNRRVGGSTNGWKVPAMAHQAGEEYDRFVLLTDMQLWDSSGGFRSSDRTVREQFELYRTDVNPDAHLYTIDLASYGQQVVPEAEGVYTVSGWTDSVLDYMEYVEEPGQIVREIAAYDPRGA